MPKIMMTLQLGDRLYGQVNSGLLVDEQGNLVYAYRLPAKPQPYEGAEFVKVANSVFEGWKADSFWSRVDASEVKKFSPDQPRDDHGRFSFVEEGSGGGSDSVRTVTSYDWGTPAEKSPRNPGMLDRKATMFWVEGQNIGSRYQQVGNDIMRHTMEGQLGLPTSPFAQRYEGWVNGKPPYDMETVASLSRNMLESLDSAKLAQPELWRGISAPESEGNGTSGQFQQILDLRVGDTFASPMFSASRDPQIAQMYSKFNAEAGMYNGKYDTPVIFRIEAGAKGLATNIIKMDDEVLTGGKFQVTDVVDYKFPTYGTVANPDKPYFSLKDSKGEVVQEFKGDKTGRIISLKQIDTFGAEDIVNPSYVPDNKSAPDDFSWKYTRGSKK